MNHFSFRSSVVIAYYLCLSLIVQIQIKDIGFLCAAGLNDGAESSSWLEQAVKFCHYPGQLFLGQSSDELFFGSALSVCDQLVCFRGFFVCRLTTALPAPLAWRGSSLINLHGVFGVGPGSASFGGIKPLGWIQLPSGLVYFVPLWGFIKRCCLIVSPPRWKKKSFFSF